MDFKRIFFDSLGGRCGLKWEVLQNWIKVDARRLIGLSNLVSLDSHRIKQRKLLLENHMFNSTGIGQDTSQVKNDTIWKLSCHIKFKSPLGYFYFRLKLNSHAVGMDSWPSTGVKSIFQETLLIDLIYKKTPQHQNNFIF